MAWPAWPLCLLFPATFPPGEREALGKRHVYMGLLRSKHSCDLGIQLLTPQKETPRVGGA